MVKLKNGKYTARQRISNRTVYVRVKNGVIQLEGGRTISPGSFESFYDTVVPFTSDKRLYDIEWYVGGKLVETIPMRCSYPVCKYKMNILKNSTHKTGLLTIIIHE